MPTLKWPVMNGSGIWWWILTFGVETMSDQMGRVLFKYTLFKWTCGWVLWPTLFFPIKASSMLGFMCCITVGTTHLETPLRRIGPTLPYEIASTSHPWCDPEARLLLLVRALQAREALAQAIWSFASTARAWKMGDWPIGHLGSWAEEGRPLDDEWRWCVSQSCEVEWLSRENNVKSCEHLTILTRFPVWAFKMLTDGMQNGTWYIFSAYRIRLKDKRRIRENTETYEFTWYILWCWNLMCS